LLASDSRQALSKWWWAATEMTKSVARSRKAAIANHAHFEERFALIFNDITIPKVCERL
jgi:hypothetical protein